MHRLTCTLLAEVWGWEKILAPYLVRVNTNIQEGELFYLDPQYGHLFTFPPGSNVMNDYVFTVTSASSGGPALYDLLTAGSEEIQVIPSEEMGVPPIPVYKITNVQAILDKAKEQHHEHM